MRSCKECGNERCLLNATEGYCLDCPECGVNWKEKKMPFINWVKTPDGYKPVEITDEEMKAQNAAKKAEREKAERIREQLEIVNDKNFDRIKDSIPVPKVEPVNCKDCDDTVCCERGKDKLAYCPRCFETKEREMEFDKSRVYTALNADELRAGDKVIVADTLEGLKHKVQEGKDILVLQGINPETWGRRFSLTNTDFALAYLVERNEKCTHCPQEMVCEKAYTVDACQSRYRPFKDTEELIKVWEKKVPCNGYRPRGTRPLIWVHRDDTHEECLIVTFDNDSVYLGHRSVSLHELWEHFTFLDGSVCGVEE